MSEKDNFSMMVNANQWIESIFLRALDSLDSTLLVERFFQQQTNDLTLQAHENLSVIAVGKAAFAMAQGAERFWGNRIKRGMIVTKDGHTKHLTSGEHIGCLTDDGDLKSSTHWTILETGHPIPDNRSFNAALSLLDYAEELGKNDVVIVLLSGGASSLLIAPREGVPLDEKIELTRVLLNLGVDIHDINCVRKHLSVIKGGAFLKKLFPARGITLALSDVSDDRPSSIGSGLTVPDPTTFSEAFKVLLDLNLVHHFPNITRTLLAGMNNEIEETLKEFYEMPFKILASNKILLQRIAQEAQKNDISSTIDDSFATEDLNSLLSKIEWKMREKCSQSLDNHLLLFGGEPSLKVEGSGKGGRMQHLGMLLAFFIKNKPRLHILLAGSDGTDGLTDVAGAVIDSSTFERAYRNGADFDKLLHNFASYVFHQAAHSHLMTNPTGTNLNDVVIVFCSSE